MFIEVDDVGICTICLDEDISCKTRIDCTCKSYCHPVCLYKWLKRKRQCPMCNDDLVDKDVWKARHKDDAARTDLDNLVNHYSSDVMDEDIDETAATTRFPYQVGSIYSHVMVFVCEHPEVKELYCDES